MIRSLFKDRTFWAVLIIIVALTILGLLQFALIRKNLRSSKAQFDQEIAQTLALTNDEIAVRTPLSNLISGTIRKDTVSFPVGLDSLQSAGARFYKMFLTDRFRQSGITADFEFALIDILDNTIYLQSEGFKPGFQDVGNYKIPVTGYIKRDCGCAPYLNVRIIDIRQYLMRDIWWTLIPGIAGILLLGAGFFLLIRLVREQRYLNRIKNDFINHLTHEIKTPLFATRLSLKLLEEKTGPEVETYIKAARHKNDIVASNVEKILELASLEDPGQVLHQQRVNMATLIHTFIRDVDLGQDRIRLENIDAHAMVMGDPDHIRNTLMNLVDNALKYSDAGAPVLVNCKTEGKWVVLAVSDKGVGIEKDEIDLIFTKFYRSGRTTVSGFGLGLSYVKQVVKMMQGRVHVISEPGKGSTFFIHLPLIT